MARGPDQRNRVPSGSDGPLEEAVAHAREIDGREFLSGAKRNRENQQAPERATQSSTATGRRASASGLRTRILRHLTRRLQARRVPHGEPQGNPKHVRHFAHHEWIADEARDQERDQPGSDTSQPCVAGSLQRRPDASTGSNQNPDEQRQADKAQFRAEAEEVVVGVHATLPQGAQFGRREFTGQEKEPIETDTEQRPGGDDVHTGSDQLATYDQRLSRHLSREIATGHPRVTEHHDDERDDGKADDASNRSGLLADDDETQDHQSDERGSNDRPRPGEVDREDERHARRHPGQPASARCDGNAQGHEPAQREVRSGRDVVGDLRRDSQSNGGCAQRLDGAWVAKQDFPQPNDAQHGEAGAAQRQHAQRSLEERRVHLATARQRRHTARGLRE